MVMAFMAAASLLTSQAAETPKVGDKAPIFEGKDQDGKTFKLADVVGKKVVLLYFYPKDETPGCTKEACGFRDRISDLKKQNVEDRRGKFRFIRKPSKIYREPPAQFSITRGYRWQNCRRIWSQNEGPEYGATGQFFDRAGWQNCAYHR